ncbi:hypothetical protein [Egicoccus halophilus]|uniref:Uncharacterized protein n=1 Tax=Egicoccus halophilus TaxID=1670830 RepID=A0A8J3ETV0_9ACTN|nr:hypothetical protein [Egicoccus halophilus]GGI04653.1 hypothetical protein GCM10011354_10170 [Egicoccus halophilus]
MRTVELTVPQTRTDDLLDELDALEPAGLRLQRDGSLLPPGDVVTLQITNEQLGAVMQIADRYAWVSRVGFRWRPRSRSA